MMQNGFMDLLNDVLQITGLKSRLLNKRSLRQKETLEFPCNRSMGFHVILQGEVQLTYGRGKKEVLRAGDIGLMARGIPHSLANVGSSEVVYASGVYQLWNDPIHPFFAELPDWWILRGTEVISNDPLADSLRILSQESVQAELGSEAIKHHLLDIVFQLILRRIVKAIAGEKKSNWATASQDAKISKALHLMHRDFQKAWSLDDLASEVGLSRAGFAQKFKTALGDTPLSYLSSVRIQKAMQLLTEAEDKVESIAEQVGYADAFTFSKSFKKRTGLSPTEFRAQSRSSRDSKM